LIICAAGESAMSDPAECQIIGRWRIVEADQWDRNYLDLVDPAFIAFDTHGHGELVFGVVTVSLRLDYARTVVFFQKRMRSAGPGQPNSPTTTHSRLSFRSTTAMMQS
jgi:hypothetical protein